jgi:microcystin-dependent protein
MASPFLGDIRMFGGTFAPAGWMLCQGQTLSISDNSALFSLIGTTYGGDGQQTFNLPDLRGRVPVHMGQGPGLSPRILGEVAGSERVTLTANQLPSHTHSVACSSGAGSASTPVGNFWAANATSSLPQFAATADSSMSASQISQTGGNQSHDNLILFLGINFIISVSGTYPSQ